MIAALLLAATALEAGGLQQWASYPPVQDVGYDPTLAPAEHGAVMRVVRPTRRGELRLGFIKRLNLVAAERVRIAFQYRLNLVEDGDVIEIGLAAGGRRYQARIAAGQGWTRAETAFAPPQGTQISAVYLLADMAHGNPDITYKFLINEVAVEAAPLPRVHPRTPASIAIEPWAALVSAIAYRPGQTIAIDTAQPSSCTLEAPGGRALPCRYTVRASDPAGVWVAQFAGTKLRMLVGPAPSGHPRLYFGPDDRQMLIARTRNPKVAPLWAKLVDTARQARDSGDLSHGGEIFAMLDPVHLLPTLPGYFDVLERARTRIAYNALAAWLTGDSAAREAAKSTLLEVARWKRWDPPWFEAHGQYTYYPAGELAADVALAYDLLYGELSESERALVRQALLEQSIVPAYREYVLDNRIMANTSNWIASVVSGALVAAAAIWGDEDNAELPVYVGGLLLKLEDHMAASYLPDGSYGEGIGYEQFDLQTLSRALVALERVVGIDYWDRTNVLKALTHPIYTLAQPPSGSLDMGDSGPPAGSGIAALARRSKDPVVRWFYERFPHAGIEDFLFFDDSVPPQPPALPPSRLFPQKGNAVFRTGWGPDDAILLFRAGPNFNHNHADQGSFLLRALGENLVTEGGWAHYYNDPYYATYFSQAAGHNTVLVDGDGESQAIADTRQFPALDAYPRITSSLTSRGYDAVASELASVYRGRLERFTRRIVFVKSHYVVVYDDLAARGAPASFDWLLHLPDRTRLSNAPGLALYTAEKAALAVRTLAPQDAEPRIENGKIPYGVFAPKAPHVPPPQPVILDLHTPPSDGTRFLVALVPARTADQARALASAMREVSGAGWTGIKAVRGAEQDLVLFGTGAQARYGEWTTDAAAWTAIEESGKLKLLAAEQARTLNRASQPLFRSERPVNLEIEFTAGGAEATYAAPQPTRLELFLGGPPVAVEARTAQQTITIPR